MKSPMLLIIGMATLFFQTSNCTAFANSWAMTPEHFQQHMQREDNFNDQMFRIMSEEIARRRNNPYSNCQFISRIEGKNPDEIRRTAVGLGATHLQLELVTSSSATGAAYKCP
jgi:hypothetical protein